MNSFHFGNILQSKQILKQQIRYITQNYERNSEFILVNRISEYLVKGNNEEWSLTLWIFLRIEYCRPSQFKKGIQ